MSSDQAAKAYCPRQRSATSTPRTTSGNNQHNLTPQREGRPGRGFGSAPTSSDFKQITGVSVFVSAGERSNRYATQGNTGKLTRSLRHNNRVLLEIKGEAGRSYILEASTNLVNWRPICVVWPDKHGDYNYEDVSADMYPCRFYPLVIP